jgi:tetratricopeptide (TPR) repeat protein
MAIYDAFISYSHAKDKPIAAALQSVVQTLGKPWYRRRALRIFRDDTSLSATPHLWPTIEIALSEARFLILLASAESAHSMWVGKEVTYWLERKSAETLLIAVTDGDLSWPAGGSDFAWSEATPLPEVLKGKFAAEPKWVDLRPYREGASKRDRKFTELGADFAAAIRGMPKEDLLSEEVRQQRRALTLAWSAVALLLVLGAATAWQWRTAVAEKLVAQQQQQIAEQQRDRAERTLNVATSTANGLVSDLAVKFREVKGIPLDTVQSILDRGKSLLDGLLSFNKTSPAIELVRAAAWSELGFTLGQQGNPEGGKLADEGHQIAAKLAHDNPDLDGVDYAVGRSAEVMGQLQEREDAKAAYNYNREANDAFGKCLTKNPKNLDCLKHEFMVLGRIGNMLFDVKQYNDALSMYRKSLELAQGYAQMVPPGPEVGLDIGGRYNHLGRVAFEQQDMSGALQNFRLAQSALEPWANDPKASVTFLLELSSTYNNIANVLANQAGAERDRDKLHQAISYTARAASLMESLSASDPANLFYWSNLAIDYNNLQMLNGADGNHSAQEAYDRKRQDAMARAKMTTLSSVAQAPPQHQ